MKRTILYVMSILLIIFVAISFDGFRFLFSTPSTESREIIFEVPPGSFHQVAESLKSAGLITNAQKFVWLARLTGQGKQVRIGEYALRMNMRPTEVLSVLVSGKSVLHSVTLKEGINLYEIADLLEAQKLASKDEFLKLVFDSKFITEILGESLPSLEGYLFPETYAFTKYTGTKKIVRTMIEHFLDVYKPLEELAKERGMTRHQVVTLASMVEKETGAIEERPLISSVFHNRLKKKMRLQSDPTIIYGILADKGVMTKNITREDLKRPNRYNTYTVDGLPYGPICNPGSLALAAVLKPATSEYLYFVSHNDGTHQFSATYKEHEAAVKKFQLDPKAREGHSWRDLKSRKN